LIVINNIVYDGNTYYCIIIYLSNMLSIPILFYIILNVNYIIMCKTGWRNHAENFRELYIIIVIIIIQIFLVYHVQRLFFIFIINTWLYCQLSLITLLRRCCVPFIYIHHTMYIGTSIECNSSGYNLALIVRI